MDKYIGKILDGRYEILSLIGVGGMSYVYKANCSRLSRHVAIKILKDEFANDSEFKSRFHNESNAVARLAHKNIVSIYDVSNNGDLDYIVMELIEGISIKEYLCKKQQLDWKQTLFFSAQIAEALDHAHSRGIIHQDIKPHNIMLLRDGTLKVADFGIAKLENDGETKVIKEAIGSVHYISPEQAKGSTIDIRTDIYSLGIVMYEMVTGRIPFKGENAIAVVMQHINSLPTPPTSINSDIPKSLEYVILKAMNPTLKNRYKDANEFLCDLEKVKNNPNIRLECEPVCNKTQIIPKDQVKTASKSIANNAPTSLTQVVNPAPETPVSDTEQQESEDQTYSSKINPVSIIASILIVFAIVVASGNFIINKIFVEGPKTTPAPYLLDLSYEIVKNNNSFSSFNIVVREEVISDMPAGTIITQQPEPSEQISEQSIIYVTVSLGPKTIQMPNLENYLYTQAETELTRSGLSNISIEFDYSEDFEEGYVIATQPSFGQEVTDKSEIVLVVSSGKKVVLVKVPNLDGLTTLQAKESLENAQLTLGEVTDDISIKTEGTVIAQGVQNGVEILSGTPVNIVIAKSPPEPEIFEKTITINIPQDPEFDEVNMEVRVDNEVVHSKVHKVSEQSFELEVTGETSVDVYVYAEGILVDEQVIVFD